MLESLIDIAAEAGRVILAIYEDDDPDAMQVEHKADDSPLTRADREANAVIVRRLETLAPDIPIITEEAKLPAYDVRQRWKRFWLVDPLDGTKEFIKRNGEFTVNIALIEDGEPVLGVVRAPALGVTYAAAKGEGARRIRDGEAPEAIFSTQPTGAEPLRVVTSRSHGGDDVAYLLPGWPIGEQIPRGSSLKLCVVADGTADVYPRKGPTMEWDVAAGDCVYRNSGRDGQRPSPLTYNKPTLKNGSFVIGIDE